MGAGIQRGLHGDFLLMKCSSFTLIYEDKSNYNIESQFLSVVTKALFEGV